MCGARPETYLPTLGRIHAAFGENVWETAQAPVPLGPWPALCLTPHLDEMLWPNLSKVCGEICLSSCSFFTPR